MQPPAFNPLTPQHKQALQQVSQGCTVCLDIAQRAASAGLDVGDYQARVQAQKDRADGLLRAFWPQG